MSRILGEPNNQNLSKSEQLAVFALCIQSFPDFDLEDLQSDTKYYRFFPTQELSDLKWISDFSADRWRSRHDAADWAYEVLQGSCVNSLSSYSLPIYSIENEAIGTKFIFNHDIHSYLDRSPETENRGSIKATPDGTKGLQHTHALEANHLTESLNVATIGSSTCVFWRGSLAGAATHSNKYYLQFLMDDTFATSQFLAYNSDSSFYFMRIAANLMDYPPLQNVSDAELLNQFLPWGSRTVVFYQELKDREEGCRICTCFMKPLPFYPPIKVEFREELFLAGEHNSILEKLLAYFILNPHSVH